MTYKLRSRLLSVAMLLLPGMAISGTQVLQPQTLTVQPEAVYAPMWQTTIPEQTAEQRARSEEHANRLRGAASFEAQAVMARPTGAATSPVSLVKRAQGAPEPLADSDPAIFRDSTYGFTGGQQSIVMEPSHATMGKWSFVTGNWFAAKHTLVSGSWTYINPYADFPSFCCDQDVIYDRGRNLLIWYRQGLQSAGVNTARFSVSKDRGETWTSYNITSNLVGGAGWFDYPHLSVTDNYVYLTTNKFSAAGSFVEMGIIRLSLEQLAALGGVSVSYYSRATGWSWAPAAGGTRVAYFGDHTSQTAFNVCDLPESTGTLTCRDVAVPAWTFTNRGTAVCTEPSGNNPCARLDQRVNAGYVRSVNDGKSQEVGFYWTVKQGGAFPYPYVEAVSIDPTTWAVTGRPLIWNSSYAWVYAGAYPNVRGDLGLSTWLIGGGNYANFVVGIKDGTSNTFFIAEAGNSSSSNTNDWGKWGDYTRVRPNYPLQTIWTATGHVVKGGTVNGRQVFFGRERDRAGWDQYKSR